MNKTSLNIYTKDYKADPNNDYQVTLEKLFDYGFHKIAKIIFIIFFLILPILNNILGSYSIYYSGLQSNSSNLNNLIIMIINLLLVSFGFIFIIAIQGGIIFKTGAGGFFAFSLLMSPIMFLFSFIVQMILPNVGNFTQQMILVSGQLVGEIIVIFLVLKWNKFLFNKIKNTLKSFKNINYFSTFILILGVGFAASYILSMLFQASVNSNTGSSNNQNSIESMLSTLGGKIVLIPMVAIVAPIAEELACREGIFGIFGKKNYSIVKQQTKTINSENFIFKKYLQIIFSKKNIFIVFSALVSILYFANMHVQNDFQHIYIYFSVGIVLVVVYLFAKRNIVYSIGLHSLWNIVSLIIGFIQIK